MAIFSPRYASIYIFLLRSIYIILQLLSQRQKDMKWFICVFYVVVIGLLLANLTEGMFFFFFFLIFCTIRINIIK